MWRSQTKEVSERDLEIYTESLFTALALVIAAVALPAASATGTHPQGSAEQIAQHSGTAGAP